MPHGGDYDGVAGVVVPLEIIRAAREDAPSSVLPMELVVFAEEEGTTFGLGMLGIEWRATKFGYFIFEPNVSVPIPRLKGLPFSYYQYRVTVGLRWGS